MNTLQARLLIHGLEMEIRTEGRMQMTREPAMRSIGRLLGIDAYAEFGRGVKGRQKCLDWLKEALAEVEPEVEA